MRKSAVLLLVAVTAVSASGCGVIGTSYVGLNIREALAGSTEEELIGSWVEFCAFDDEELIENLELLDFTENAIPFAEKGVWGLADVVTFREDGSYQLGTSEELYRKNTELYLRDYFQTIYEHCGEIEEFGATKDDFVDVADFMDVYANSFFYYEDGEAMIADFVDFVVGWYNFEQETGTYEIVDNSIRYYMDGEEDYTRTEYQVIDDVLTLRYSGNNYVDYQRCAPEEIEAIEKEKVEGGQNTEIGETEQKETEAAAGSEDNEPTEEPQEDAPKKIKF